MVDRAFHFEVGKLSSIPGNLNELKAARFFVWFGNPTDLCHRYAKTWFAYALAGCGNTDRKKWGLVPKQREVESKFHHLEI